MLPKLEDIQPSLDGSFAWKRFRVPAFPYVWHFHPEVELTLILASEGHRLVGDSIESFGPGDLCLLGASLPHTWHTTSAPQGFAEAVVVQFPQDLGGSGFRDQPEARRIADLLARSARGLHFPADVDDTSRRLEDMQHQHGLTRLLGLMSLLDQLARRDDARPLSAPDHALPAGEAAHARISRVCRFMAEHYAQPITQNDAAASIHLSPSSFSRFFRRMTGRTFVAYLHELRIADACRRLRDPEARVTGICLDCGFDNLSNFNRVFLKLRGTTPTAFRAALLNTTRHS